MMTLLRRFCVVIALMFWQGGFTFYAAVVVPIGQQVLGAHFEQGLITRRVTVYLNLAGLAALLPLAWDMLSTADTLRWRCWARWLAWAGMLATLLVLFWLHPRMDSFLDPDTHEFIDRRAFAPLHRIYLWLSTAQWLCGIVYALFALWEWSAEDRVEFVQK